MSVHSDEVATADQYASPGTSQKRGEHGLTIESGEQESGGRESRCELTLTGALDLAGVPLLEAILRDSAAGGCREIHVDLAGVSFLDCIGLSVLLTARARLSDVDGRLVLRSPSWSVRRLVCLADLCPLLGFESGEPPCRHSNLGKLPNPGAWYPAAGRIGQDRPLQVTGARAA